MKQFQLPKISESKEQPRWKQWLNQGYIGALIKYMTTANPTDTGFAQECEAELRAAIKQPLKFGFIVIGVVFGFFIVWGGLAPLDSASIAEGMVMVAGNRKTVQHLEGGVISSIVVQDGQHVNAGDVLITLNDSNARAQLQMVISQLNFAYAARARLEAAHNGYEKIKWEEEEFDFTDPQVRQIIKTQENLFNYRKEELSANQAIIKERITQNQIEIQGLLVRQQSLLSQQKMLQEELNSTEDLFKKGLALRPKLLELRRVLDDITSGIADIKTRIAAAKESIAENELKVMHLKNEYQKEIAKEIKENHSQILELIQRYKALKDVLERTTIKAPVDGVVTDLKYHTIGGVITPGQKIMDIIPNETKLIIEARVKLQDIDSMKPGLVAKVQLGAYKSRLVPRLDGKVIYVSADTITDPQSGHPYYLARIEINEEDIRGLTADIKLYPGMPATVFIVKGTRTFLQYLISPIMDSFYKAFKEK